MIWNNILFLIIRCYISIILIFFSSNSKCFQVPSSITKLKSWNSFCSSKWTNSVGAKETTFSLIPKYGNNSSAKNMCLTIVLYIETSSVAKYYKLFFCYWKDSIFVLIQKNRYQTTSSICFVILYLIFNKIYHDTKYLKPHNLIYNTTNLKFS